MPATASDGVVPRFNWWYSLTVSQLLRRVRGRYVRLKFRRRKKLPTVMSFKISHMIPRQVPKPPPSVIAHEVAPDVYVLAVWALVCTSVYDDSVSERLHHVHVPTPTHLPASLSPVANPGALSKSTRQVAQSKSSRNLLKSADELEASVYDALHGLSSRQHMVGSGEVKQQRPDAQTWGKKKQPKGGARHHARMDQLGTDGQSVGVDAAESAAREVGVVTRRHDVL